MVARFLALLELYREGSVSFDQVTPLGELYVTWVRGAGRAGGGRPGRGWSRGWIRDRGRKA